MGDFFNLEPTAGDDARYEGLEDETFGSSAAGLVQPPGSASGFFEFAQDADQIEREKQEFLQRMAAERGEMLPPPSDDATFGDSATFGTASHDDDETFGTSSTSPVMGAASPSLSFNNDPWNPAATSPSVGVPAQPPARDSIWGSSPSVRRSLTDIIHADQTLEAGSIWASGESGSFYSLPRAGSPSQPSGERPAREEQQQQPPSPFSSAPQPHQHQQQHGQHVPPYRSAPDQVHGGQPQHVRLQQGGSALPMPGAPASGGPVPSSAMSLEEVEARMRGGAAPAQHPAQHGTLPYPPQQGGGGFPNAPVQHVHAQNGRGSQQPHGGHHSAPAQLGGPVPSAVQGNRGDRQPVVNFQQLQMEQMRQQQEAYELQQREAYFSKLIHQRAIQVKRNRWAESKEKMTAHEIEGIIRLQEQQLKNIKSETYVGDYYFQAYYLRKFAKAKVEGRNPVESLPPRVAPPMTFHLPICDSPGAIQARPRKQGASDPLAGALGRIPAHTVKAPRALLQIKSNATDAPEEGQSEGEQRQSLMRVCYPLVLIEDCFTCLLDLEDLDLIVASTPIQVLGERSYYNILKKRQAIVEVFCSICGINTTSSPLPQCDETLVLVLQRTRGKKLLTRAMKSLPVAVKLSVLLFAARNLAQITACGSSTEQSAMFLTFVSSMDSCTLGQLAHVLEVFVHSMSQEEISSAIGTTEGVMYLAKLFQTAKQTIRAIPAEAQSKELRDGLVAWKLSFSSFVSKAQNQFSAHTRVADGVDQTHADRVWGLLGTIVSHTEPAQTQVLLQCLKDSITQALQHNPTGAVRCLLQAS